MTANIPPLRRARLFVPLLGLAACAALAQVSPTYGDQPPPRPPAEPRPVTTPNYRLAAKYSNTFLKQFVYDSKVDPNWIGKTDTFWYSYRTARGLNFYKVNPRLKTKEPLFDRAKLGTQLGEALQKPVDLDVLPVTGTKVADDGVKMSFNSNGFEFGYDLTAEKLTKVGKARTSPTGFGGKGRFRDLTDQEREELRRRFEERRDDTERKDDLDRKDDTERKDELDRKDDGEKKDDGERKGGRRPGDYKEYSPDNKMYLYAQRHNLYLAEEGKEAAAVQITKDGAEDYSFGGDATDRKARPIAGWSKDSKRFHVTRRDTRGVKDLYLVNSLATPRPTLQKYKYAMPGEEAVEKTEMYVYDRDSKKLTKVATKWKDEGYRFVHWGKTSDELRFVRRDRLLRHAELCSLNTVTNEAKCVVAEGFENAHVEFQPVRYIDETDEMVWWSERSGWGHFYLYTRDGKLKNAITSGPFRASRLVAVDAEKRQLYFQGNGREPGENVYYTHMYCVHLDGTGLTLLDPGNASHNSSLAPTRQFLVDNSSRIDEAPTSVVRDAAGRKVMDLESADLSKLAEVGWKMPEAFTVKAADGITELYGNMWKPFDFDPYKKYPIVAHVYPGPQQEGVTHTFTALSGNQQLAQVGFIVIQVGHRGGSPTRSKAYGSFGYQNLRDYGLADKKFAIEQLAARHPFIDVERVGIYGHSGGGFMSAAAVLQKPYNDFFKAAVASAGNHDNNIYNNTWAERYHGLTEVPATATTGKEKDRTTIPPPRRLRTGGAEDDEADEGEDDVKKEDAKKEDAKKDEAKKEAKTDEAKKDEAKKGEATKEEVKKGEARGPGKNPPTDMRFEIKVPTNAELAENLKGHLLLVHGDMDNNVHPANTMRLADALIKANKRFDMLILPGKRHGFTDYQPYFQQRMQDFFVEHLIGEKPTGADIYDKTPARR